MDTSYLQELARRHHLPGGELTAAVNRWQREGGSLALCLLDAEAVEDLALADALARMLSLPRISASLVRHVDRELYATREPSFWLETGALPFRRPQDGSLLVGCVDPSAENALPLLRAHLPVVWKPGVLSALHFAERLEAEGAVAWRLDSARLRDLRQRLGREEAAPKALDAGIRVLLSSRIAFSTPTSSIHADEDEVTGSIRPRRDTANLAGVPSVRVDTPVPSGRFARIPSGKVFSGVSESDRESSSVRRREPSSPWDEPPTVVQPGEGRAQRPVVLDSGAQGALRGRTPGRVPASVGGKDHEIARAAIPLRAVPPVSLGALLRSAFPIRLGDSEAVAEVRSLLLPGLRSAQHRDDVARELVENLELLFPTVVLFSARQGFLSVRSLAGTRAVPGLQVGDEIDVSSHRDWVRVWQDARVLAGTLDEDDPVGQRLGLRREEPVVAMPIELGGRVVLVLMVGRGHAEGWPDAGDLLMRAAATAAQSLTRILIGLREPR